MAAIAGPQGTTDLVHGAAGWAASINPTSTDPIGLDIHQSATTAASGLARSDDYNAFGVADGAATFVPTLGYRGELTLADNVHLRARDYRPDLGRFTSRDPIQGVPGSATVANAYHYTTNSPLNGTDPTGMFQDGIYSAAFVTAVGAIAVLTYQLAILTTTAGIIAATPPIPIPWAAIGQVLVLTLVLLAIAQTATQIATLTQTSTSSSNNCNYRVGGHRSMSAPGCQKHHIIQHAAVKDLQTIPRYTYGSAQAIVLSVPAHGLATAFQNASNECSATFGGEQAVAAGALGVAGVPPLSLRRAMKAANDYFRDRGVTSATTEGIRTPGTRVPCK